MKDNNERDVAAVYLEECYISNHGMQLSANSIVVAENVSLRFERVIPIKVRQVNLNDLSGAGVPKVQGAVSNFLSQASGGLVNLP
jgi:hypothetical protein